MIQSKSVFLVAITTLALTALAGCATDVEPSDNEPVVAAVDEGSAEATAINAGCTSTSDGCADGNYCCTTTTCPDIIFTKCVPKPQKCK